jgi:hypothetical protein
MPHVEQLMENAVFESVKQTWENINQWHKQTHFYTLKIDIFILKQASGRLTTTDNFLRKSTSPSN